MSKILIDKVCGEGILPFGTEILKELGLMEAVRVRGRAFHGIAYHHNGCHIEAEFSDAGHGIGIERSELDKIFREALEHHPTIRFREGVSIRPGEEIGDKRVMLAQGVHGPWPAYYGLKAIPTKRLGLRFRVEAPPPEKVTVHFFPSGEIYLTPTGENSFSAAMLLNQKKLPVKGGGLKRWALDWFRECLPEYAQAPIRDFATRAPVAQKLRGDMSRVHLLGDGLRAFDPITGSGMGFALLCAKHASENLYEPNAYYRSIRPSLNKIRDVTNLLLFFKGGGLRRRLMFRQLQKSPGSFERILRLHNELHPMRWFGVGNFLQLLRV